MSTINKLGSSKLVLSSVSVSLLTPTIAVNLLGLLSIIALVAAVAPATVMSLVDKASICFSPLGSVTTVTTCPLTNPAVGLFSKYSATAGSLPLYLNPNLPTTANSTLAPNAEIGEKNLCPS